MPAARQHRTRTSRPGSARGPGTGRGWKGSSVGVDLGGTKIALGVVDRAGGLIDSERIPTRADRPASAVIADIVASVRGRWGERLDVSHPLGVGVAGQVDRRGTVRFGPNLNWHEVPLGRDLARELGRPVSVLNDVQAATFGEWQHGAGRGLGDLVCLFVGTGIGGGIVAEGRLQPGATGTAGELGHMTVAQGGRKCHCPNSGCLEAYASGWAIAERARQAVADSPARGARLVTLAGDAASISSLTVEEAFRQGDALARELVEETLGYLTSGLVSIVNALNPAMIVLGGGVLEGFAGRIPALAREVRARALRAASERLKIVPAALGGESGLIGAAAYARQAREA